MAISGNQEKKRSSSVERMTHLIREAISVQSEKLQYASVVGVGNGPPDEGGNQRAIREAPVCISGGCGEWPT